MSFSNAFKINVNKLNATEALLVLLEIRHPFLSQPIYLVNDNINILSNGHAYISMGFKIKRQSDVQGELPKVSLTIPNVGRSLVKWIDSSGGATNAEMTVILVRRSDPNIIEESLDLGIESVSVTTENVVFSLIVQNNLTKKSMNFTYDQKHSQGLF